MERRNTYSQLSFFFSHVYWCLLTLVWYRSLFFRLLPQIGLKKSYFFLALLLVGCLTAGWLLTQRRNRNFFNLLVTLLLPYEIYTLAAFRAYFRLGAALSAAAALVLSAALCLWILLSPIAAHKDRRTVWKNRLHSCLISGRAVWALCLSSVLIFAVATQLNGGIPIHTPTQPTLGVWSEENTIRHNMDVLIDLQDERWAQLTAAEKLNVLQAAANVQRNYLGIPHELVVKTDLLEENVLGSYSHVSYRITVDALHLENSRAPEVLRTLTHECYHAYQHAMVDLYLSTDAQYRDLLLLYPASLYAEELADYTDGTDPDADFLDYYLQAVESDARDYANDAVLDFYTEMERCLAAG